MILWFPSISSWPLEKMLLIDRAPMGCQVGHQGILSPRQPPRAHLEKPDKPGAHHVLSPGCLLGSRWQAGGVP